MSPHRLFCGWLSIVIASICAAHAQQPQRERFDADGTLEAIMPGRIQMMTNTQQKWLVSIPLQATVEVNGTATLDALHAGVFVEFKGEVDNKGTVKDKLSELTICTPAPDRQPGIFPPGSDPKPKPPTPLQPGMRPGLGRRPMMPGMMGQGQPGQGQAGQDQGGQGQLGQGLGQGANGGGKTGQKSRKQRAGHEASGDDAGGRLGGKTEGKRGDAGEEHVGPSTIRGRVSSFQDGKLAVATGRTSVHAELAEDAKILFVSRDYSLAAMGDRVSVRGQSLAARPGFAQANSVTIELTKAVGEGKKKPTTRLSSKKSSRSAKKTDADHSSKPGEEQGEKGREGQRAEKEKDR